MEKETGSVRLPAWTRILTIVLTMLTINMGIIMIVLAAVGQLTLIAVAISSAIGLIAIGIEVSAVVGALIQKAQQ